jgi:hypothetical protein
MFGTTEIIVTLIMLGIPLAILAWFALTLREVRDRLRTIDRRLEEKAQARAAL